MARKLRVEYPGAIHPLMYRGDRREPIFQDDPDRRRFLETLTEACTKTEWQVHAYGLMGNHFHLVVETPQGNLVAGMKCEMVSGHLHSALQPPPQTFRPPVQRSLQVADRGRHRHRLPAHGVRLRAFESRAGERMLFCPRAFRAWE